MSNVVISFKLKATKDGGVIVKAGGTVIRPKLIIAGPRGPKGNDGTGAVLSVNGKTGAVVLDTDDISDSSSTHKYVTAADVTKLGNLSGVNTGDQDLSGLVPKTTTVNGHALSSNVTVSKSDIGLGNADNTSDANKPVSTAQATALGLKADTTYVDSQDAAEAIVRAAADGSLTSAIALKAALDSPAFTGTPTVPTASIATNSTQAASTAYVFSVLQRFGALITVAPYGYTGPATYRCAGATNNQVEINQAQVEANSSSYGGIVELLPGSFTVSASVVPLNKVWMRGSGMFMTKLGITSSANTHIIDNYTLHNPASPWTNGMISDLELDGSGMNPAQSSKGINSNNLVNCKFFRIYCHDTTATGLGADDFNGVTIADCIVTNCGFVNKHTITAASWSSNTLSLTIPSHGYSIGSVILITGMVPIAYNGRYVVTTVPDANSITIGTSNNSNTNNLTIDPGTATTLGLTSDSLIGHNGIGIASGASATEANIITNNFCFGNNNNNFLIEADTLGTSANASYIFSNNVSVGAGQNGYLSTGTPNVQFNNNYDYGSQYGAQINQVSASRTIAAASWSGSVATYTINTAYTYTVGQKIAITGMTPSGYNGYFTIASQPDSTHFTVAIAVNPGGSATVLGSGQVVTHNVDGCQIINNVFINNGLYGIRLPTLSDGVMVENNVIEGCLNYGIQTNSSNTAIAGNRIYGCGRDGLYIITGSGDIAPMHHVLVTKNHIYNNSQRVASQVGIEVQSTSAAPITDLTITDNMIYDAQDTKTQNYGVIVRSSGTLSNVQINNNDLSGNATGSLLIQYTGDGVYASNNMGANPIGKSELGTVTGTIIVDSKLANFFTWTLGGNISATFPVGIVKGGEITVLATQDATGSRTITWSGLIIWGGGGAPTLSTAPGATDTFKFVWNGTNWIESTRVMSRVKVVSEGGTGTGSFSAYGLLTAGTTATGPLQQVSGVGSSGQVLTSSGASALPTWQSPVTGITRIISSISSPTTAGATASTDYVYLVSGTTTLTLPTAVSNTNRYTVKNAGSNTVTIATTSAQTIDSSSSATLLPNDSLDLISTNTNWEVI